MDDLKTLAKSQIFSLGNKEVVLAASSYRLNNNSIVDAKYRIESLLGEGGMGAVYKAKHLTLNKAVALKTFQTTRLSEDDRERFHREAKVIARLRHENIVEVYDSGIDENNTPYYTMELLQGESLADKLEAEGLLSIEAALNISIQICRALKAAHNKGIVHRDLKPANIFLVNDATKGPPKVKIVDFGIAGILLNSPEEQRLTAVGTVFGSPLYMSPEQGMGEQIKETSDIYSCGCTLYEALCGRPPFHGANALATIFMHQNDPVPPLLMPNAVTVPQRLHGLVARMLEKNKRRRPQSFSEVETELQLVLNAIASKVAVDSGNSRTDAVKDETARADRQRDKPSEDYDDEHEDERAEGLGPGLKILLLCLFFLIAPAVMLSQWNPQKAARPAVTSAIRDTRELASLGANSNHEAPSTDSKGEASLTAKAGGGSVELPAPYAHPDSGGTRYMFPPSKTLGTIRWSPPNQETAVKSAKDSVYIPITASHVYLTADDDSATNPELLRGFGKNDLNGIQLADQKDYPRAYWSDKAVEYVSELTSIQSFTANNDWKITDASIPNLNKLPLLTELSVNFTSITGKGLTNLNRLNKLTILAVRGLKDLPVLLNTLQNNKQLVNLDLKESNLTDSDLKLVAKLKSLRTLNLDNNPSIKDGIKSLTALPDLAELHIVDTSVGPDQMQVFPKLKSLRTLRLSTAQWNSNRRSKLNMSIPSCKIVWTH